MATSAKIEKHLKDWLKTLERWSSDPALEARVRFKIRDLLDQVRAGWVARHETNTVKKTADIRKQAHAELGMVQAMLPAFLQDLPALGGGPTPARAAAAAQEDLGAMYFPGMGAAPPPVPDAGPAVRPDAHDAAQPSADALPAPARSLLSDADIDAKTKVSSFCGWAVADSVLAPQP